MGPYAPESTVYSNIYVGLAQARPNYAHGILLAYCCLLTLAVPLEECKALWGSPGIHGVEQQVHTPLRISLQLFAYLGCTITILVSIHLLYSIRHVHSWPDASRDPMIVPDRNT